MKRVCFEAAKGTREVEAHWDRRQKGISCIVPPLTWLFGGEEVTQEVFEETRKSPVKLFLTCNNQEWIPALEFSYHDVVIERLSYANFGEGMEPEEVSIKLHTLTHIFSETSSGCRKSRSNNHRKRRLRRS